MNISEKDKTTVAAVQYAYGCLTKCRLNLDGDIFTIACLVEFFGGTVTVDGDDDQCWINYSLKNPKTGSAIVVNAFATSLAWANQISAFSGNTMVFSEPTKVAVLDNSYIVIE